MKNISTLYKDISVLSNGEIVQGSRKFSLYEITPVNVIEKNENIKQKIYSLYYSCVKGMPSEFKILVVKEKVDISSSVAKLQKRADRVNSTTLKKAIKIYENNLKDILSQNSATVNRYYIVTLATESVEENFHTLEEIGITIKKLTNENEVQNVFRKEVLQEVLW